MYCSSCGFRVTGNFCSQCGARVVAPEAGPASPPTAAADWSTECRYQALIANPVVRDLMTRHASRATKGLSADAVLGIADKILPLFVPTSPIPYAQLGAALAPLFAQLGIATGKERTFETSNPVGTVIVAALCSLASHAQPLGAVKQMDDGCLLEATIASDILSFGGTIYIGVQRTASTTHVALATKIPGQRFDWGKSNRLLDTLAADMNAIPD